VGKIITKIEDEDVNFFKKQYIDIPQLYEQIEQMFAHRPEGRKKKELKNWKEKINFLIDIYNKSCKFKSYNHVK
jgi:hypothetical protein